MKVESEVKLVDTKDNVYTLEIRLHDVEKAIVKVAREALNKIGEEVDEPTIIGKTATFRAKIKALMSVDALNKVEAALGPHTFRDC